MPYDISMGTIYVAFCRVGAWNVSRRWSCGHFWILIEIYIRNIIRRYTYVLRREKKRLTSARITSAW